MVIPWKKGTSFRKIIFSTVESKVASSCWVNRVFISMPAINRLASRAARRTSRVESAKAWSNHLSISALEGREVSAEAVVSGGSAELCFKLVSGEGVSDPSSASNRLRWGPRRFPPPLDSPATGGDEERGAFGWPFSL